MTEQLVVKLAAETHTTELSQIEAAEVQIDRAIQLHMEADYVCAVTLACAAESMLGEHLQARGSKSVAAALKAELSRMIPSLSHKEINDTHLNNFRNFLKHARVDLQQKEAFRLEQESLAAVVRATQNFAQVAGRQASRGAHFSKWLCEIRTKEIEDKKNVAL